jgi:hypothetical protein
MMLWHSQLETLARHMPPLHFRNEMELLVDVDDQSTTISALQHWQLHSPGMPPVSESRLVLDLGSAWTLETSYIALFMWDT